MSLKTTQSKSTIVSIILARMLLLFLNSMVGESYPKHTMSCVAQELPKAKPCTEAQIDTHVANIMTILKS